MNNFEKELENEFKEDMQKSDDFCCEIWSSLANIVWVHEGSNNQYSCTFRQAGGLIADIIGSGDYIDWYCCGPYETVSKGISDRMKKRGWVHKTYDELGI